MLSMNLDSDFILLYYIIYYIIFLLYHIMSNYSILYFITFYHTKSYYIVFYYIICCFIISFQIVFYFGFSLYYIILYHIILYLTITQFCMSSDYTWIAYIVYICICMYIFKVFQSYVYCRCVLHNMYVDYIYTYIYIYISVHKLDGMSTETRCIQHDLYSLDMGDAVPEFRGRLDRSPIAEHLGRSDQPWLD